MSGILAGAIRGLGKGMVQNAQHDMEQERYMQRQAMEQEQWTQRQASTQQGQKDMEVWRQELATELRQKLGREVDTKASELMSGNPKMTEAEAKARSAGELTGNFGVGLDIETKNRDFNLREADRRDASARGWASVNQGKELNQLKLDEARSVLDYTKKYRSAVESGNVDEAKKYGAILGLTKDDRSTNAQLISSYNASAKQADEAGEPDKAKLWRNAAVELAGLGGGKADPRKPVSDGKFDLNKSGYWTK